MVRVLGHHWRGEAGGNIDKVELRTLMMMALGTAGHKLRITLGHRRRKIYRDRSIERSGKTAMTMCRRV